MHKENTHLTDQDSSPQATSLDGGQCIAALAALQHEAHQTGFDPDRVGRVSDALFGHYRRSAEAAPFTDPLEGPRMLADLAASHQQVTITALSSRHLEELLFSIIATQVAVSPDRAAAIVQTSRALYVWLGRAFGLEQAYELVELLGDDATRELEQRLAEPEHFGAAKELAMEILMAGIDPLNEDELNAFMRKRLGVNVGSGVGGPSDFRFADDFDDYSSASRPSLTPEQKLARQKKRKSNRKAARKARKKNR